jgi:hypothetical protein
VVPEAELVDPDALVESVVGLGVPVELVLAGGVDDVAGGEAALSARADSAAVLLVVTVDWAIVVCAVGRRFVPESAVFWVAGGAGGGGGSAAALPAGAVDVVTPPDGWNICGKSLSASVMC